MLMVEGQGMHKSKGNFITLKGAIDKYGADATRCGLLIGAEGMDDPDWRADNVSDLKSKFDSIKSFVNNTIIAGMTVSGGQSESTVLEHWLQCKLQYRIEEATLSLDGLKTRTALQTALFEVWNDIRWYMQRKNCTNTALPVDTVLVDAVKTWLKLLAPFAPYMCEELWSQMGETGFISTAPWPKFDESKIDIAAEEQENMITDLLSDTQNILKATKIVPKQLVFYTAAAWKWQVYLKILEKASTGEAKISELMREFSNNQELKPHMKDIVVLVPKIIKTTTKLSANRKSNMLKIQKVNEKEIIQDALNFLKDRFNTKVNVYSEDNNTETRYDPKNRAQTAIPYQPAIYIE
jgi:leucyl-tRNA synthetase